MKVDIKTEGVVVMSGKNASIVLDAIRRTGIEINCSEISRATNIPITTIWDNWKKIKDKFDIEVSIVIKEKRQ